MISYTAQGVKMPRIRRRDVSSWIRRVAATYGKMVGEVGYCFVSDERILEVNKTYLQHDYFTDIITFDYSKANIINGDIFISLDTVRSNAEQYRRPYEEELRRVIIHGVLHLCGLEDKGRKKRQAMEEAEDKALGMYEE